MLRIIAGAGAGDSKWQIVPLRPEKESEVIAKAHFITIILAAGILLLPAARAAADPCLVVYPMSECFYRYDPSEYYTVGAGHPLYDPALARGGEVLLERGTGEVDWSIYQAPNLTGFLAATDEMDGYFFGGRDFTLIVDGFSNIPTTYRNILIVFGHDASACDPRIAVNGSTLAGWTYAAGDLTVSTPTEMGNSYSDIFTLEISWRWCRGLHVWAFSDENYNGVKDGGECFTAYSHDITIGVEQSTWGAIKEIYR